MPHVKITAYVLSAPGWDYGHPGGRKAKPPWILGIVYAYFNLLLSL